MDADLRADLRAVRIAALEVHGALVASERLAHEREHGRVGTPARMLELVMHDERFAWLHPLSELIVAFDQMLELPDLGPQDAAAMRFEVETLFASEAHGFHDKYHSALQDVPGLVMTHATLRRALAALPPADDGHDLASARGRWTAPRPRT